MEMNVECILIMSCLYRYYDSDKDYKKGKAPKGGFPVAGCRAVEARGLFLSFSLSLSLSLSLS